MMALRWGRWPLLAALLVALGACALRPSAPKMAPLPVSAESLSPQRVFSLALGEVSTPLQAAVVGNTVVLASSKGRVLAWDVAQGRELWRAELGVGLLAGVGSDGRRHAVVSQQNDLLVLQDGRELWRQRLPAQTFTAPLVAGERVFVLQGDRNVAAFDGATGQRLWQQQRNTDPLLLRQAGLLMAYGDTLLAGNAGRLSALLPATGQLRWEATVGSSRGANEIERLVDVVAGTSRQGATVCARAFQAAVACVDAQRGQTVWSRPSAGHTGVDGDADRVFGTDSDSRLRAWRRSDGEVLWVNEDHRFRGFGSPRLWGPALAFGDAQGQLHLLDPATGRTLKRLNTDGTPVAQPLVVVGGVLLSVNRSGNVTGWRLP